MYIFEMTDASPSLIKPKRLLPGGVIGVAAPSGPYKVDEFKKGIAVLRDMGFRVRVPENLQQPESFLAASDEHRVKLLKDLFKDPGVSAIVCARGGYGAMRVLERLDYDVIRSNPKSFVGFSDISALHAAIIAQAGLVVFHGPMVASLGKSDQRTRESFLQSLTTDQLMDVQSDDPILIHPGISTGVVAGGNMATLCHLLGTSFAPIYRGCIVLLEDTSEAPYKIDRMLIQMKMAGSFDGIKGVALGSFHDCGSYQEICDIVGDIFKEFNVPVLAGFAIGHNGTNLTIPLGLKATLDTEKGSLQFNEPATI